MPLRGNLRLALVAPAAALILAAGATPASALTGAQEIAFLNAQRAANGIPADVTENPAWSAGCAAHMEFLRFNNLPLAHDEGGDPDDKNPAHHLPHWSEAGVAAGGSSVLTSGGASFSNAGVNAFEQAPIHLMQMLNPFLQSSGAADGCLATLRDINRVFPAATTFSYPGDGALNVPASEVSFEGPFVPAAFVGLAGANNTQSKVTGPSLYFYNATAGPAGFWSSKGQITSATLTGPAGPVEVRTVDNSTTGPLGNLGQFLSPGGIVIPVSPLQKDQSYTATVNFTTNGGVALSRTWSFVTGPVKPAPVAVPVITAPVASTTQSPAPGAIAAGPGATAGVDGPTLVVSAVTLKARSLSFKASDSTKVWVTIELRKPKKGKSPTKWVTKRSFAVTTKAKGATRVALPKKLARGKYRVRLREGNVTGDLITERSLSVR